MPKVSVIVPVYNGERYIASALEGLIRQTIANELEIIVINDGSSDDSQTILEHYSSLYNNISVFTTENFGAAHARNIGLQAATGDYIGFVDCDDQVDITMFEKLHSLAVREDADIATCGYFRIDGGDEQRRDYVQRPCFGYNLIQAPSLLRRNVPYIWNKVFKRSFLHENGFCFDEDLGIYEDLLFTYKAFLKANKVVRVSETLYTYAFTREGSLTSEFSEKRMQLFPAFERLICYYKEHNAFFHVQDELLYVLLVHIYSAFENDMGARKRRKQILAFFNKAIAFLDEQFPWWRHCDTYYKQSKKAFAFYSRPWFISLFLLRPKLLSEFGRDLRIFRKRCGASRVGMKYARWVRRCHIEPKRVLIDSQHGRNLNGNMFYLLERILTSPVYDDFKIDLSCTTKTEQACRDLIQSHGLDEKRINFVYYNSAQFAKALARDRFVFSDTSMPVYFVKRNDQVYLNTWHGTPLKRLGRDMENDYHIHANLTKNFLIADYLAFQSEYMNQCMRHAFTYSGVAKNKTVLAGYPRNSIFFDKQKRASVRKAVALDPSIEAICYMPTWRGILDNVEDRSSSINKILLEIDDALDSSQKMFVNLHPYDRDSVDYARFRSIRPFPQGYETYEFLNACDTLITDYSSVMFDFASSRRKTILFAYDKEEYLKDRGLYLDFDSLALPVANTISELIYMLKNSVRQDMEEFCGKFCPKEGIESPDRLLSLVLQGKEEPGVQIRTTRHPESSPSCLLIGDEFANSQMFEAWKECLNSLSHCAGCVAVHYDSQFIRNKEMLKEFDEKVQWMGVSYPYTNTTMRERWELLRLDMRPLFFDKSPQLLDKIMLNEWLRAYGGSDRFDRVAVYAGARLRDVIWASVSEGMKFLIVTPETREHVEAFPGWLSRRFSIVCIGIDEGAFETLPCIGRFYVKQYTDLAKILGAEAD